MFFLPVLSLSKGSCCYCFRSFSFSRCLLLVQVGTLVTLYSSQEDQTAAADVLSKAISWYQNSDVSMVKIVFFFLYNLVVKVMDCRFRLEFDCC